MNFMSRSQALAIIRARQAEALQLETSMTRPRKMQRGEQVATVAEFTNSQGHAYARIEECNAILQVVNRNGKIIACGDRAVTREQVLATVLKTFW